MLEGREKDHVFELVRDATAKHGYAEGQQKMRQKMTTTDTARQNRSDNYLFYKISDTVRDLRYCLF